MKASEATARIGAFGRKFQHQKSRSLCYWYNCKKINFSLMIIVYCIIINCFQFWTENFAATIYWKFTITSPQASFRYLYFAASYWKITNKSQQAHTVSIYFSQPVMKVHEKIIVSCHHSRSKLLIFVEKGTTLSVFISCSKLLKVNNNVTRQVITICFLQQVYRKSTKVFSIYFSQKSYCYWKFTTRRMQESCSTHQY